MKLTKRLLERHYAKTFYSIIGFTIGSIFVLMPQGMTGTEYILSILCVILGIYISHIPDGIKHFRSFSTHRTGKALKKVHFTLQSREKDLWNARKYSIILDIEVI